MVTGVRDSFFITEWPDESVIVQILFIDRGGFLPAVESFERYYRLEQEISLILA
jgi:hypothetical protein